MINLDANLRYECGALGRLDPTFPSRLKYTFSMADEVTLTLRYNLTMSDAGMVVNRNFSLKSPAVDCHTCTNPLDAELNCHTNRFFIDADVFKDGESPIHLKHVLSHLPITQGEGVEIQAHIHSVVKILDEYTYAYLDNLLPTLLWPRLKRVLKNFHQNFSAFSIAPRESK